jgi:hypothetical protein
MHAKIKFVALAAVTITVVAASPGSAEAQCADAWVTRAIQEVKGRAPQGSGNSGECNIDRYGAGSWTDYQDLKTRVRTSYACNDPWIGQVIWYTYSRNARGSGTTGECNVYLYGGANWSGYMDLAGKVKRAIDTLASQSRSFDRSGNLVNGTGGSGTIAIPVASLLIQTSNGVVAAGGGNVVAAGGGNVIAAGGGNVVAAGGGNLISARGGS